MTAWAVEVNECRIFASGSAAANDWWAGFLLRADRGGRATCLDMSIGGGRWLIACEDREHAESLRGFMVEMGVHEKACKARRASTAGGRND